MIIADSSAALEVLLNPPAATEIARHLFAEGESIHAPHLIDIEVLQVLRRYARSDISSDRAEKALKIYERIALKRYPHNVLAARIWELRHLWTAYDAAYIALAEALDAPLITRDRALASRTGHRARVLVL